MILLSASVFSQESRIVFREKYDEAMSILYDDPKKAVELVKEAHEVSKKSNDHWAMGVSLAGMGFISYELEDYSASFLNYTQALELLNKADTVDLSNKVLVLNELALIQSEFNNHDESIRYSQEALVVAKEYVATFPEQSKTSGQESWLVDIPYYMALEYAEKGAYQTAGKILFDLWEGAEDKDDVTTYAHVLNELGSIKLKNGEFSAAQEYFGLIVSAEGIDDWEKAIAYHNLADSYMEQGEYQRANNYFLTALDLKETLDDSYSQFISYQDIGELEFRQGNTDKAIEYWETALNTYSDIETNPELYSIYNWLQRAYMDVDIEKAKEFNARYTELNNFYVKNQSVQRELEAQNRQELSNMIDQQRQLRVDAAQRQEFLKQFWPVLLGVGLLVLFSIIMGIRYYRALRANRALSNKHLSVSRVTADEEAA